MTSPAALSTLSTLSTLSALDLHHMAHALSLAQHAIGLSDPNPRVGCVITSADRQHVLAEGHTREAGGAHAEADALAQALQRGTSLRGATVYVTLEPCAHHGRTPPCADALVAAGIGRVVVALGDPFPAVAGRGIQRLREAGIAVLRLDALPPDGLDAADAAQAAALVSQARELNLGFLSRVLRGRPWVRMKIAASMDGRTALHNGASQWITGEAARADGHAWRRRAGAVLTGYGTVQADDPRLDVRLVPTARQPLRVVVDAQLRTPVAARIVQPPGEVLLFSGQADLPATQAHAQALRDVGAQVCALPDGQGKVDLTALLHDLAQRGINELHIEAGAALNGSFLRAGLVDELLLYLAPMLLGDAQGLARLGPFTGLNEALRFEWIECQPLGTDLRLRARPPGRAVF